MAWKANVEMHVKQTTTISVVPKVLDLKHNQFSVCVDPLKSGEGHLVKVIPQAGGKEVFWAEIRHSGIGSMRGTRVTAELLPEKQRRKVRGILVAAAEALSREKINPNQLISKRELEKQQLLIGVREAMLQHSIRKLDEKQ